MRACQAFLAVKPPGRAQFVAPQARTPTGLAAACRGVLGFMRSTGLIEKRIFEARKHHGWRRQRALVALGRMRAAEGLASRRGDMASIFAEVVAAQDRYALHAYLAAIENAGLRQKFEAELQRRVTLGAFDAEPLLAVLHTGKLAVEQDAPHPANEPAAVTRS